MRSTQGWWQLISFPLKAPGCILLLSLHLKHLQMHEWLRKVRPWGRWTHSTPTSGSNKDGFLCAQEQISSTRKASPPLEREMPSLAGSAQLDTFLTAPKKPGEQGASSYRVSAGVWHSKHVSNNQAVLISSSQRADLNKAFLGLFAVCHMDRILWLMARNCN